MLLNSVCQHFLEALSTYIHEIVPYSSLFLQSSMQLQFDVLTSQNELGSVSSLISWKNLKDQCFFTRFVEFTNEASQSRDFLSWGFEYCFNHLLQIYSYFLSILESVLVVFGEICRFHLGQFVGIRVFFYNPYFCKEFINVLSFIIDFNNIFCLQSMQLNMSIL